MTTATASAPENPVELKTGDKAPAFDLPADSGQQISLASLRGKKLVLYFYPKDDTPGCTVEAKEFAELHAEYEKAGAVVLGVSKCTVKKHDKFKEKYCLPFTLLSDNAGMSEAYGTWIQKAFMGRKYMGIARDTYLIDGEGVIRQIWRKVTPKGHAAEVLEAVSKL